MKHMFAPFFQTPKGNLTIKDNSEPLLTIQGVNVKGKFRKYQFVRRRLKEISYGKVLAREIMSWTPDVVISSNSPLDPQRIIFERCRLLGIPFVFWLQDYYSLAIERILKSKNALVGSIIGKYYKRIERGLLRNSNAVIAITPDFVPLLSRWQVEDKRIHVIPNWAPIEELPRLEKNNSWSRLQGLDSMFCFIYSGTLSFKHNPFLLLQLANHHRLDARVRVVVISEGPVIEWLKKESSARGLTNMMFYDFQPFNRMPEVLASGDVLVAILEPGAGSYSVPSKILTYLCAGRALLVAVPNGNLGSRIVVENECGLSSDPDSVKDFLANSDYLVKNEQLRSTLADNAFAYAMKNFDIDRITDRFESIIRNIQAEGARR